MVAMARMSSDRASLDSEKAELVIDRSYQRLPTIVVSSRQRILTSFRTL